MANPSDIHLQKQLDGLSVDTMEYFRNLLGAFISVRNDVEQLKLEVNELKRSKQSENSKGHEHNENGDKARISKALRACAITLQSDDSTLPPPKNVSQEKESTPKPRTIVHKTVPPLGGNITDLRLTGFKNAAHVIEVATEIRSKHRNEVRNSEFSLDKGSVRNQDEEPCDRCKMKYWEFAKISRNPQSMYKRLVQACSHRQDGHCSSTRERKKRPPTMDTSDNFSARKRRSL